MPQGQLQKVVAAELGPNWRNKMATFEDEPLAAASIGQVSWCTSQVTRMSSAVHNQDLGSTGTA